MNAAFLNSARLFLKQKQACTKVSQIYEVLLTQTAPKIETLAAPKDIRLPAGTVQEQISFLEKYIHDENYVSLIRYYVLQPKVQEYVRLLRREKELCRRGPLEFAEILHLLEKEEAVLKTISFILENAVPGGKTAYHKRKRMAEIIVATIIVLVLVVLAFAIKNMLN